MFNHKLKCNILLGFNEIEQSNKVLLNGKPVAINQLSK